MTSKLPVIRGFIESSCSDWPGMVCAVLFLGGCNFRCPYCHNHQLVLEPKTVAGIPWEQITNTLDKLKSWLDGVCVSGGEPTLQPAALVSLCRTLKDAGFKVKLDTNGSNPAVVERLLNDELIDFVAMDVKAPLASNNLYAHCTGIKDVDMDPIRATFNLLVERNVPCQFRTTWHPALFPVQELNSLETHMKKQVKKDYVVQYAVPDNALADWFRELEPVRLEDEAA